MTLLEGVVSLAIAGILLSMIVDGCSGKKSSMIPEGCCTSTFCPEERRCFPCQEPGDPVMRPGKNPCVIPSRN